MPSVLRFCWVLPLLLLAGCAPEPTTSRSKAEGKVPLGFHDLSLDEALALAKTEDKLVMVDFYADWCPPCRMLDSYTWPDPAVQAWLQEKTVAIKNNVDDNPEVWAKYRFKGIPILIFLRPDGSEVGRLSGFRPPQQFLKDADQLLAANAAGK
jgi:thiol:disulfide interchange protein